MAEGYFSEEENFSKQPIRMKQPCIRDIMLCGLMTNTTAKMNVVKWRGRGLGRDNTEKLFCVQVQVQHCI